MVSFMSEHLLVGGFAEVEVPHGPNGVRGTVDLWDVTAAKRVRTFLGDKECITVVGCDGKGDGECFC